MKLEGSLDAFSLPDIFALLSMTKKSGGLHLHRGAAHGVVWFTTGSLTGGASDLARQGLGRRLVSTGLVTDELLADAVAQVEDDPSIGLVRRLKDLGAVDDGLVHDVVSEHVVDTVFDLLRWGEGEFAFALDEPNPDDVGVSVAADEAVGEARRRLDAWASVAEAIPTPATVLTVATGLTEDPQLTRDDWQLVALVDGRRSIADLVALAGRGEFAVVTALADLVRRGLLRADEDNAVAALLRRQAVLSRLESAAPQPAAAPEPPASPVAAAERNHDLTEAAAPSPMAVARPVRRGPVVPTQAGAADAADVTPARPEPFLPKRRPEHPEHSEPAPLSPMAAVAGGGAVAGPVPQIERDPSVNKSLLLRLIAGVRGL